MPHAKFHADLLKTVAVHKEHKYTHTRTDSVLYIYNICGPHSMVLWMRWYYTRCVVYLVTIYKMFYSYLPIKLK